MEHGGAGAHLESVTREREKLFQNLPDVFFSVDVTEERLIQISPSAEGLFGRSLADLLSSKTVWQAFLLPSSEGGTSWSRLAQERPRDPVVQEYSLPIPGGPPRWVRASVKVDVDPSTQHVRADGLVADITQEYLARQALLERNRELAALHRVSRLTLTSESLGQAYREMLGEVGEALGVPVVLLE